jgi:molybdopterin molybdotransferase/putative molybdopterin biosynthesis protein
MKAPRPAARKKKEDPAAGGDPVQNRLREARESRGLGQGELARETGLTRQAVYAIETNRYQPNVAVALRLARVLGVAVEDLFAAGPSGPVVEGEALGRGAAGGGSRAAVWTLRGRTLVLPLSALGPPLSYTTHADGLIVPAAPGAPLPRGRLRVQLLEAAPALAENVVVAGCDPAIHIVGERLRREHAPGRLVAWPMGSTAALAALGRGEVHVAGLHVVDPRSGESNVPFVRQHLKGQDVTLVTFAAWEAGLLVAPGNPRRIRAVADLGRRDVRLVNREPGSGARLLLDQKLRAAGLLPAKVRGYDDVVGSHLEVGRRVAEGHADAGVGVEAIGRLLGLHFVPLQTERYDLVIPTPLLDSPGVARLLDALVSRAVRAEVEALGGYDTSETGRRFQPHPRRPRH